MGVLDLPDGVPCKHPGCLSHLSHPCEGCGRIGGKNKMSVLDKFNCLLKNNVRTNVNCVENIQQLIALKNKINGNELEICDSCLGFVGLPKILIAEERGTENE